jgi:hypothetical protein
VRLKAGKTYWIGRYNDDVNPAGINRTLGADIPIGMYRHVDWIGGTSFTSTSIAYPTTYYYFYGLEFEAADMKQGTAFPEKNLYKSDADYLSGIISSYYSVDAYGWTTWIQPSYPHNLTPLVDVKPNTFYTFSVEKYDPNALMRIEVSDENVVKFADTSDVNASSYTFYTGNRTKIRVKHQSSTTKTRKIMLCEGSSTDYKPYQLVMKPNTKVPKVNLFPSDTLVPGTWQGLPAALNKGTYETNTFRAAPNPVRLKPGTYTLSSKFPLGAGVQTFVNSVNIILSSSAQLPQTFNISYEADVYFHFRKNDGTPWSLSDNPVDLGIQLESGSLTEFKPYELAMKPAILYPKKNMISNNPADWAVGKISGAAVIDSATLNVIRNVEFVAVKPSTTYTISQRVAGKLMEVHEMVTNAYGNRAKYQASVQQSMTFTTHANTNFVIVCLSPCYDPQEVKDIFVQLELGSVATPYEQREIGTKPL